MYGWEMAPTPPQVDEIRRFNPTPTANDFLGGVVTAVTANGIYKGTFVKVLGSPDVSAILSPVPEAESYALALAGLAVVGGVARRRSRKA